MKKCSVYDIRDGEILAKPVFTSKFQVLLSEGTVLKEKYISLLKELGIEEVYIKEEEIIEKKRPAAVRRETVGVWTEEDESVREEAKEKPHKEKVREVHQKCKKQIQNILENHIYQENKDLCELSNTTSAILDDILEEENVVEKIIEINDRSPDLYEHSVNCSILSTMLALRLKLGHDAVHAIGVGCLLHDMGLRYMQVQFANIDMENMPENQKAEYKKHTIYGYSSVEKENWLEQISKNIILSHHERLDGTGFPFHSREIPTEIRIMSICDAFDEAISGIACEQKRVYEAIESLKLFKNTKFDGKIVDEFLKIIVAYPIGSRVRINTGEVGVVIRQNKEFPEKPVLRIVEDKTGKPYFRENALNLLEKEALYIQDVLD